MRFCLMMTISSGYYKRGVGVAKYERGWNIPYYHERRLETVVLFTTNIRIT